MDEDSAYFCEIRDRNWQKVKFEIDYQSSTHDIREKQQIDFLLHFLQSSRNYCVCIVDMVGSTITAMKMSDEKIAKYYGLFLNSMAETISSYGATIVKNIGDMLNHLLHLCMTFSVTL